MARPNIRRARVKPVNKAQLLNNHIELLRQDINELEKNEGIFNWVATFFTPDFPVEQLELKKAKLAGLEKFQEGIADKTINSVASLNKFVQEISNDNADFLSGGWHTRTSDIIDVYRRSFTAIEYRKKLEVPKKEDAEISMDIYTFKK